MRLALLALTVLLAACNGGQPPPPPPTPLPHLWPGPTSFGAQSHDWPAIQNGKPVVDTAEMNAVAAGGFTVERVTLIPWETPTNPDGTWNFAAVDALYSDLLHRNLTPLFMPASPRSAADMGEITAYLVVAAGRYPKAMLELGNEPDSPVEWAAFYPPNRANPITPAEYWGYAEQWAKAWASSQPSAQIATAGTSGVDLTWQQGLVAAGAANSGLISAFGVHPYAENIVEPPGVTGNNLGDDLTSLKAMLPANVSVWLTEYGEPNPPPADVTAWLTAAKALGVPVFSWYELKDGEGPYGLLNADLSRKAPDPYKAAQQFLLGP